MSNISWSLQTFKISELKDYHKNPRRLTQDQYKHLKASIDRFGLIDKPIVTRGGTIIGGHQRIKVLKKDKVKEIDCWVPDRHLQEKDIEELNIRLNKNQGEWDFEILANQWNPTDLIDWGFTLDELQIDASAIAPVEEDNEVLEPGKDEDAITKPHDLLSLGEHIVICGDSTMEGVVECCLKECKPILMVTDPPYGVNYDASWRKDIKDKHGVAAQNNTAKGGGVYDPFLGSGTTLIACEQLDRKCYGIEISPAYCDIIVKRWIKYRTKMGKDAIVKKNGEITQDYVKT